MKKASFMCAGSVFGIVLASAQPVHAQDQVADPNDIGSDSEFIQEGDVPPDENEAIVVTGSRIARPSLESQVPVTSITGEEFFNQGSINVGDTLNDLPQLRSTFSQTNSGRFLGTTGLNLLDLRGLGTARTLTLVNGRRHVPSDILSNGTSTDVNTIPNDLIERVDVVTGGNSAIYGSDAIAGVVNFILRDDFDGLQLRGHASVSDFGSFPTQYVSALAGKNFADGRGNITVHAEFANQSRVYGRDVPFLRRSDGFLTIDIDGGGLPENSDGFPDRAFFRDIRTASIFYNGLVPITRGTASPNCGTGLNDVPFNCTYLFTPDGKLVEQTGTRLGTGPIGSIVGGNGQTGREFNLLSVIPDQKRYNFNVLGHFELAEAFVPFVEAKYVRIETQGQQSSPAFVQGVTFGDNRELVRLDNPFLSQQARGIITNQILDSGFNSSLVRRNPLTDANLAAIADGSYRFTIARSLQDLGSRDEQSKRDVYRIVGGVRGEFNDDWNYEVSANYGRVEEATRILGNIIPQRFLLALDSGINPATGQIACRSQFDPAAAEAYDTPDVPFLQQDIDNCVPYNPFGAPDNSAAANYIVEDTTSNASLEQLVFSGFVSGDLSQVFELPGGPIGFALGAEYRREELSYKADPIVENGRTFYNALPTFAPDPFEVREAFGEIRIPLLADIPFFEELTFTGSGRVSDYKGAIGTVYAYNAGFEWSPISDIRFRGQYGRSVRAPNLTETSFPITQNFAPGFQDPCRPQNINTGSENRAANCRADLGGLLDTAAFRSLANYSLEILSGSNPNLTEETSDSYTIGAVFQPRFIPGFSLTVDYYDIRVDNVITAVSAQNLVDTCYDLPSLDNPFCALITRFRGPGTGPNNEIPGQILDNDLVVSSVNFAARTVRGIDAEATYRTTFGNDNAFNARLIYTHLLERSNFEDPSQPDFEDRILGELGDPQDEFRFNAALKLSNVTFGYEMRYIGSQVLNTYEDFFGVQDRVPENSDYADTQFYPETFYHDASIAIEVDDSFEFNVGVDNILGTNPPLGLTGIGGGSAIYRVKGRNLYAGVRARF
ncbi:TonB-dependent receptor domain-containing protein [Novosphingopyxis sp.]|uniref:TonB-dependent receptor domain-containing protein n=1 Tax=Novosphingopyxis sp. TaxID=2709690 RepID=UPI003B59E7C6